MSVHLEGLRKDYHNGNIVPFIGAGLSIPFKIPSWGDLIENITEKYAVGEIAWIKKAVETDLKNHDYWGAIDVLKKYAPIEEEDIQESVVELIQKKQIKIEDNQLHNYSDLSQMNFNLYLTTNYEHLLQQFLKLEIQPILLKDILFNTQNMFDQRRICHLHGTTSNSGTIVLSRESYKELYENKKYDDLLKLVTGTKKILFMGFSFDDQFIKTLIKEHKESFKGTHYILLNNPSEKKIKEMRSEYGLLTIPYNVENSTHPEEVRKILQYISNPISEDDDESSNSGSNKISSSVVVGAGLKSLQKNLEGNTFYKKLKLENINQSLIDLSSAFYIAADEYIREMRKLGMPIDVVDLILGQVFIEYTEKYVDTYSKHGDSEEFLKIVHISLENIDYGRYKALLKDNITNKYENKGFVHILADDEDKEIWWGEERFNGAASEL
ncbi:SIR2 family protein [Sutcliffiella horikoshii]|uniref:SIR2 family protein n=1 Tax=Sutcliffiella horikoshii TaxID=79883 RepID=UPI003CF7768E